MAMLKASLNSRNAESSAKYVQTEKYSKEGLKIRMRGTQLDILRMKGAMSMYVRAVAFELLRLYNQEVWDPF